jgi:hypothetical protein
MISSDLHGAEEPIRWTLGWQRQDSFVTSPCTERRRTPSPGRFGRDLAYGDQPLCRWDVDLDGQDVTRASWTFSGADSSMLGLLGTHDRLQEPPGSQRLAYWMMILP